MQRHFQFEALELRTLLAGDISFSASLGRVLIEGTSNVDQAVVEVQGDQLVVTANFGGTDKSAQYSLSSVKSVLFRGRDADDTFDNRTAVPSAAYGNQGNDLLLGGDADDRLYGGPGDDQLAGRGGNDSLHGDHGNDQLDGGDGNDSLYGWFGNDKLSGGAGNDYLSGYEGNDHLEAGEGDDELHGHKGNDHLHGNDGHDKLFGYEGNDQLDGGDGNDYVSGWSGNDQLDGGNGDDTLRGHAGNDTLRCGAGNDLADGGSGHDTIFGDEGDYDRLFGGLDNDHLIDRDGALGMHGGAGHDTLDLVLREGWRNNGKRFDGKLSGGDGNDNVSIRFEEPGFFINITGDERAMGTAPGEGTQDHLTLLGKAIATGSVIIKFEKIKDQTR